MNEKFTGNSILHHVGKHVDLGENVKAGFGAYVEDGAEIGEGVKIGRFAEVLAGSVIGDNCFIGSRCIIGHPSKLELQKVDFSAGSPRVSDLIVKEPVQVEYRMDRKGYL